MKPRFICVFGENSAVLMVVKLLDCKEALIGKQNTAMACRRKAFQQVLAAMKPYLFLSVGEVMNFLELVRMKDEVL